MTTFYEDEQKVREAALRLKAALRETFDPIFRLIYWLLAHPRIAVCVLSIATFALLLAILLTELR